MPDTRGGTHAAAGCERFHVFHSKHAPVLRTWYRIGDLRKFDAAVGLDGAEDPSDILTRSRQGRGVNSKHGKRLSSRFFGQSGRRVRLPCA